MIYNYLILWGGILLAPRGEKKSAVQGGSHFGFFFNIGEYHLKAWTDLSNFTVSEITF